MTYPPLTESAKKLLAEYLAQPKTIEWRQRALFEASIWEAMTEDDRKAIRAKDHYPAVWLTSLCGGSVTQYTARDRTLRLELNDFPVAMIWHQLESGHSPSRVNRAIKHARGVYTQTVKHFESKGLDRASAKREGYRRFEAAFELAIVARDPANPDPQSHAKAPRPRTSPQQPRQTKTITDHLVDGDGEEAKLLWQTILGGIGEPTRTFIQKRLLDLELESVTDELFAHFRSGVHTAFQELLMNIRSARRKPEAREARQIKREHLTLALEVLRVPMKRGWENRDVNAKAVKSAYRKMSARFHPDKNPGNEQIVARYHQVQQAYELLKEALGI